MKQALYSWSQSFIILLAMMQESVSSFLNSVKEEYYSDRNLGDDKGPEKNSRLYKIPRIGR